MAKELLAAIGPGFSRPDWQPNEETDLPLAEQVHRLMDWACSRRPEDFRRSVPVSPRDHDVLITNVLAKLVHRIAELEAQPRLVPYDGDDPVVDPTDIGAAS